MLAYTLLARASTSVCCFLVEHASKHLSSLNRDELDLRSKCRASQYCTNAARSRQHPSLQVLKLQAFAHRTLRLFHVSSHDCSCATAYVSKGAGRAGHGGATPRGRDAKKTTMMHRWHQFNVLDRQTRRARDIATLSLAGKLSEQRDSRLLSSNERYHRLRCLSVHHTKSDSHGIIYRMVFRSYPAVE